MYHKGEGLAVGRHSLRRIGAEAAAGGGVVDPDGRVGGDCPGIEHHHLAGIARRQQRGVHVHKRGPGGRGQGVAGREIGERPVSLTPQHMLERTGEGTLDRQRIIGRRGEGWAGAGLKGGYGELRRCAGGDRRAGPLAQRRAGGVVGQGHCHGACAAPGVIEPQEGL